MKNREPVVRIDCTHGITESKTKRIKHSSSNNNDCVFFTNNIFTPCLDAKNKSKICTICTEKTRTDDQHEREGDRALNEKKKTTMKKKIKTRHEEMRLNKLENIQN